MMNLTVSPSLAVIVNLSAGAEKTAEARANLQKLFQAEGLEPVISIARSGAEVSRLAQQAAQENYSLIVAGGGDGTINTVAAALVGTDKILGVLPLGTLNHFAKDLAIPLDLPEAIRNLVDGQVTAVDVGEVNGRVFLNNASLGLYPSIVRYRKKQQERLGLGKWAALVWASFTVLRWYPFLQVRISTEDEDLTRETPFVFIGNNKYELTGFQIGGREALNQGQLSVYVAHRPGRVRLLQLVLSALFGRLQQEQDFIVLLTKELVIETRRRRLRVATDGEISILTTPLHFRVRPGALRVMVPRRNPDDN